MCLDTALKTQPSSSPQGKNKIHQARGNFQREDGPLEKNNNKNTNTQVQNKNKSEHHTPHWGSGSGFAHLESPMINTKQKYKMKSLKLLCNLKATHVLPRGSWTSAGALWMHRPGYLKQTIHRATQKDFISLLQLNHYHWGSTRRITDHHRIITEKAHWTTRPGNINWGHQPGWGDSKNNLEHPAALEGQYQPADVTHRMDRCRSWRQYLIFTGSQRVVSTCSNLVPLVVSETSKRAGKTFCFQQ